MPLIEDPRLTSPQCPALTPVETVHANPWFVVRNRGGYFTTEYKNPQVIVLPVVDQESIVMVRVKRPVINDNPLELPAGSVETGQTPREAAAREMAEETGIFIQEQKRFKSLPPIAGSPNRNPVLLHIFAIDLSMTEYEQRKAHDDEVTGVELLSFEEIRSFIMQGTIYVAVPIAVLARFLLANLGKLTKRTKC